MCNLALEHLHLVEIDGQYGLVNPTRGLYFTLNEVGYEIWQLLCKGLERDEIVHKLCQLFDVDPCDCEHGVRDFMTDLSVSGIATFVDGTVA